MAAEDKEENMHLEKDFGKILQLNDLPRNGFLVAEGLWTYITYEWFFNGTSVSALMLIQSHSAGEVFIAQITSETNPIEPISIYVCYFCQIWMN